MVDGLVRVSVLLLSDAERAKQLVHTYL